MRAHWIILTLTLVVLTGTACRKAKPDPCTLNCQLRAKEIGCHHPELCAAECAKIFHATSCGPELRTFMECFLHQPRDHWECSDEGLPIVLGENCGGQQAAVADCLNRSGGKL